jgi:hypothetical protein
MFSLGISYLYGNGTFTDKVKAFDLFYQVFSQIFLRFRREELLIDDEIKRV